MTMVFMRVILGSGLGGVLVEGAGVELSGAPPWELGRAPHHGPVLDDRSISRRHATLGCDVRGGGGWYVENISKNNGVFVDGDGVEPGERRAVSGELMTLQLGSVVFEVKWLEETLPFHEPLLTGMGRAELGEESSAVQGHATPGEPAAAVEAAAGPLFTLSRDGDCCVVRCKGKLVAIKPSCALALYALGSRAGEVIHGWDILDMMGGEYDLAQAISGLRRELRELLEQGWLRREEVIAGLRATVMVEAGESLEALDDAALIRRFVMSRRGHGYALMLPREQVEIVEEG